MGIEGWGTLIALFLTLMVYAYLAKDIPFFHAIYRIAAYIFIGVALGLATVMAWHQVLAPRLLLRLGSGEWWYLIPLIMCMLLLTRSTRTWRPWSSLTIAFMFGTGAALAVGGGIIGTLLPQAGATIVSLNPLHYQAVAASEGSSPILYALNALLIVAGTISTLFYFYFHTESGSNRLARLQGQFVRLLSGFGRVFIMLTFGALFATTTISRLSLLADRIRFIIETIWSFLGI